MDLKTSGRFFLGLLLATLINDGLAANKPADDEQVKAYSFEIGGYAKTDLIFSDFKAGPVPSDNVGRDLYVPATGARACRLPAGQCQLARAKRGAGVG